MGIYKRENQISLQTKVQLQQLDEDDNKSYQLQCSSGAEIHSPDHTICNSFTILYTLYYAKESS